jgi:hypothetical protein
MKSFSYNERGLATIPTVIALTILVLAVGVGITSLSLSESFVTLGQDYSTRALFYAETGAKDALVKIARNKNYSCTAAECYSISIAADGCLTNDGCARVSVSSGAGSTGDPKVITSTGRVRSSSRTVQVMVIFDSLLHGEIATASWQELNN